MNDTQGDKASVPKNKPTNKTEKKLSTKSNENLEKLKVPPESILNNYTSVTIKRDTSASTTLSQYLPNVTYSITPSNGDDKQDNQKAPGKTVDSNEKPIRSVSKPIIIKSSSFDEEAPERIIIVQSPVIYTPMRQVRIVEKQPKTIIRRVAPQIITAQIPSTLSLIRNTQQVRPIYVANPQKIVVRQLPGGQSQFYSQGINQAGYGLQNPGVYSQPINQSGYGPQNPGVYSQPINQSGRMSQNTESQSYPPPGVQQQNGNLSPGPNSINNSQQYPSMPFNYGVPAHGQIPGAVGPHMYPRFMPNYQYPPRVQPKLQPPVVIKNDQNQKSEDERTASPIMLFHDHDDEPKNGESDKNGSDNGSTVGGGSTSRSATKSKVGRNKLDFISNLFDGYYYTNINYDEEEQRKQEEEAAVKKEEVETKVDIKQEDKKIETKVDEKVTIEPIKKNQKIKQVQSNQSVNSQLNGAHTNSFSSTILPPLNGEVSRQSFSSDRQGQKFSNFQQLKNQTTENRSAPSPAPSSKSPTKNRVKSAGSKKSDTNAKHLSYPRNSVLAK